MEFTNTTSNDVAQSQVLARKYRPKRFDELIGQETVTQTITLALERKRLSHAYLFSGLRGSGKTSTARIFAKSLLCEQGPTATPCEVCSHCINANEGRHLDIIEMDAASSRKIDDIRDLIEQTKYQPASASFKIFIIDEVHMLTKEAFNALLKTLEEPPEYVKFILATTDPLKLPATILSRTQHFRFKKIAQHDITAHLITILDKEQISYDVDALDILARSGSGSLRDTLTLLDQAIIYSKNHIDTNSVTQMLGLVDPQSLHAIFDVVSSEDMPAIKSMIQELQAYECEMVIDELIAYLEDELFSNNPTLSTLLIDRYFSIFSDAKKLLALNASNRFVLSITLFKMVEANKMKAIDEMITQLEEGLPLQKQTQVVMPENSTKTHDELPSVTQNEPSIEESDSNHQVELKRFTQLQQKIRERDAELAACFEAHVSFVACDAKTLTWMSCATSECKQLLREHFGLIKRFIAELYGDIVIKSLPCDKDNEPLETPQMSDEKKNDDDEEFLRNSPIPSNESQSSEGQSASTLSDIEIGSCATPNIPLYKQELDPQTLLESDMVKKAKELFGATKLTVRSKI